MKASAQERRARAIARVQVPIPEKMRQTDPLLRNRRGFGAGAAGLSVLLLVAIAVHAGVLIVFFAAGSLAASFASSRPPVDNSPIEVAIVEPPPPEPEAKPEPKTEPEPPPPTPKKTKPKAPPPPDPIDIDKAPPPPPPKEPQKRRIVGLSLESTIQGGGGPGYAVGNTRMGKTEKVAEEPTQVEALPKPTKKVIPPPANRVATRVPTGRGSKLVKPKPVGGKMREAPYPELYKAQGLEAKVTVRVRIGADGRVLDAEVVSASKHPEFNDAALKTARTQTFLPATRDGKPVEFTITFTYFFRLVN